MKRFAVFDIDGTLIRWQLYHAIVNRLAKKKLLAPDAYKKLHDARMAWKTRQNPNAFKQYEALLINIFEDSFAILNTSDFDQAVEEIINEYSDQVYVYTRDLIKKLKGEGYCLLAISGSQHELVGHLAKHYGFDDWQGTDYERKDGKFSGKVTVASQEKRKALEVLVKKHGLEYKDSWAVGDSASDAPMLKMVKNPIAFNPDRDLFELAQKHGWKIILERKNMVYHLEQQDEQYVLL